MCVCVCVCVCVSLHRGQVSNNALTTLDDLQVPSIVTAPLKFLGMPIDANLDTNHHRKAILKQLSDLLSKVDKSLVTRRQKLNLCYG